MGNFSKLTRLSLVSRRLPTDDFSITNARSVADVVTMGSGESR